MSKRLLMSFVTAQGGRSSLSLDAPKDGLTEAEVRNAMETVVTNNVFNTSKGDLTGIKSAEIVTTTKEILI